MKKPLLIIIVLLSVAFAHAQKRAIDSIRNAISHSQTDMGKMSLLNELGRLLLNSKPDTAFALFTKAISMAREIISSGGEINIKKGKTVLAKSYTNIGLFYYLKGNNDTAIVDLQKALTLANEVSDTAQQGKILSNTGIIYNAKGDYVKALDYYSQALKVAEEINEKKIENAVLTNMGLIYQRQSDYPKALEYCLKALKIQEDMGSPLPSTLCIIGNIYNDQGQFKDALTSYQKALDLAIKAEDKRVEEVSDYLIGTVYFSMKENQKCIDYQIKSLKISEATGEKEDMATSYSNLGEVYKAQGDSAAKAGNAMYALSVKYPLALEYFKKALKINEEIGDKSEVAYDFGEIGALDIKQKKYPEAQQFLSQSLALSDSVGDLQNQTVRHLNLSELDSIKGDYKKALEEFEDYKLLNDSVFNVNKHKEITQHEMNFEFSKREDSLKADHEKRLTNLKAETDRKEQNQRIVRNVLIGGLSFAVLFALVFFFQRKRIANEKERSEKLLLNILPAEVAEELKEKGSSEAQAFESVTVMLTDFKGFTTIAEKLSAKELVEEIDYCFKGFDNIIHKYNIEKIKTIGDSYMAAGGLPISNKTHATDVVSAALEIVDFMERHKEKRVQEGKPVFEIRVGINTGHVVAGIVGVKKFAYDIWGDTVNIASRMESSSEPGKINISGSTYEQIKDTFKCTYRGKIQAKNKGEIDMYFVEG